MKTGYIKHKIANLVSVSKIVTIHYFEFDKNFKFRGERHNFWEMVYIDKGEALITAGKKEFTLKRGECVFHKPNEYHKITANGITAPNIFIISFVCTSQSMNFFKNKRLVIPVKLKTYITNIIEEGKATFDLPFNNPWLKELILRDDGVAGGQQMIKIYLEQFLILLLRHESASPAPAVFPSRETLEGHIAAKITEMIEKRVYGERVTVEELCRSLGYSRAYLSRVFKENRGCTITAYTGKVKIEEAKRLIRESDFNFTQIADMLAFVNPLYFSRVFRRVTGMAPTEYKNSVKFD